MQKAGLLAPEAVLVDLHSDGIYLAYIMTGLVEESAHKLLFSRQAVYKGGLLSELSAEALSIVSYSNLICLI